MPHANRLSGEVKYAELVKTIFSDYDMYTKIAAKNDGGTPRTQGKIAAIDGLLCFLQGFEGLDRDGLRARFATGA